MKTRRRIILENPELKLKIYLNKRDKLEILFNTINLRSSSGETEFSEIIIKPKGLEVLLNSGKKMIFLFSTLNWLTINSRETEFNKAFLFGDAEISLNGELLQNYVVN
jgi:hypothetical protein